MKTTWLSLVLFISGSVLAEPEDLSQAHSIQFLSLPRGYASLDRLPKGMVLENGSRCFTYFNLPETTAHIIDRYSYVLNLKVSDPEAGIQYQPALYDSRENPPYRFFPLPEQEEGVHYFASDSGSQNTIAGFALREAKFRHFRKKRRRACQVRPVVFRQPGYLPEELPVPDDVPLVNLQAQPLFLSKDGVMTMNSYVYSPGCRKETKLSECHRLMEYHEFNNDPAYFTRTIRRNRILSLIPNREQREYAVNIDGNEIYNMHYSEADSLFHPCFLNYSTPDLYHHMVGWYDSLSGYFSGTGSHGRILISIRNGMKCHTPNNPQGDLYDTGIPAGAELHARHYVEQVWRGKNNRIYFNLVCEYDDPAICRKQEAFVQEDSSSRPVKLEDYIPGLSPYSAKILSLKLDENGEELMLLKVTDKHAVAIDNATEIEFSVTYSDDNTDSYDRPSDIVFVTTARDVAAPEKQP